MKQEPVNIAVVGLGNWGRNHIRTLVGLKQCRLSYLYDQSPAALQYQMEQYPELRGAESFEQILNDGEVQAVVIATSVVSHYELARRALEAGKDVFIEKPMTLKVDESESLCRLADEKGRLIQVGHLLIFHPAVQYIKHLIEHDELGEIYYIYCQRLNLGVVRSDENALWSLAPHDISIANYLFDARPQGLKATGGSYLQRQIEDVIFLTLSYSGRRLAHVHVSWLDPHKIRRMTIVGSRKMVVFDDMQTTEKVRIYDKGVAQLEYENYGEALSIRLGDIHIPNIPNDEPLKLQAQHFIECVRTRRQPLVSGRDGLDVVQSLAEAGRDLASIHI